MKSTEYLTTPPAQERLVELFADRAAWVDRDPQQAKEGNAAESTVLMLLRSVDLGDLVHGARLFAAALSDDEVDAWRRSWTKTRFLFGNPANLTGRTPARVIARGASAAWLGPFSSARLPGLSRLLKPVTGVLPQLPANMEFPPADTRLHDSSKAGLPYRELHVAVRSLTLAEYLVHLHHTLTESVLRGRLRADEPIRLIHRLDLDSELVSGATGYARVHYARGASTTLRLFTWLSPDKGR